MLRGIERRSPCAAADGVVVTQQERRDEIDISRIHIGSTVGGLGLVVMAAVVAYNVPALRWLALIGVTGGVVGGLLIIYRRKRK